MKKEEKILNNSQLTKLKRTTLKKNRTFRIALCDNKEKQLKILAKSDLEGKKRNSSIQQIKIKQIGMFNFEKEEADEDDEDLK